MIPMEVLAGIEDQVSNCYDCENKWSLPYSLSDPNATLWSRLEPPAWYNFLPASSLLRITARLIFTTTQRLSEFHIRMEPSGSGGLIGDLSSWREHDLDVSPGFSTQLESVQPTGFLVLAMIVSRPPALATSTLDSGHSGLLRKALLGMIGREIFEKGSQAFFSRSTKPSSMARKARARRSWLSDTPSVALCPALQL